MAGAERIALPVIGALWFRQCTRRNRVAACAVLPATTNSSGGIPMLRSSRLAVALCAIGFAIAFLAVGSEASTPQPITVPNQAGQTVSVQWTGTIPAASA